MTKLKCAFAFTLLTLVTLTGLAASDPVNHSVWHRHAGGMPLALQHGSSIGVPNHTLSAMRTSAVEEALAERIDRATRAELLPLAMRQQNFEPHARQFEEHCGLPNGGGMNAGNGEQHLPSYLARFLR